MKIRHLATSWEGTTVAAGEFKSIVHIWDISTNKFISTLHTILDFGGSRLAVTADGRHCIAGAYDAEGVAAYSCADGALAWRRMDLKKVQRICVSVDDRRVYCCFDESPCQILNRENGKTISTWPGVRKVWESPYERITLQEKKLLEIHTLDGQKIVAVPRETFAVLSVAFAPGQVCISESGGPVRCLDTVSGQELWRYSQIDQHFLELARVDKAGAFVGICWPYEHGGAHTLQGFTDSGAIGFAADIGPAWEFAFCMLGSYLLANDGALRDALSGRVEKKLAFPT